MKLINVQQGSAEWHQARANAFTASEAPAMMGNSKYLSRNDLLKQKATGITPEVTEMQQRIFDKGHAAEDSARPMAERIIGEDLYPATATDDEGNLLASFDGITIMEDTCWEHKLWNKDLAEKVRFDDLDPHYYWQLEQQLLVSGADKVLFMCSDGTEDNMVHVWYRSQPERRQALLLGWAQFAEDLANYEHKEAKPEAIAEKQADLPALVVDLVGEVRSSNLATFKDVVLSRIQAVNTDLKTDNDFATAEETVKFFTKGEKQLEDVKAQALAQTSTIDELFKTVDLLKSEMRAKRLLLNKAVKDRKEAMRIEIVMGAKRALTDHIQAIESKLGGYRLPVINVDFAAAIKSKKTISSIQSAADDALASAKIDINQAANAIENNLSIFADSVGDYEFLFADKQQLMNYDPGHLKAEIKSRIAEHKEAEAKRLEAEREKIRQQEEARILAEQQAAESARIQKEQRDAAEQQKAADQSKSKAASEQVEQQAEPRFIMPEGRKPEAEAPLLRPAEMVSISPEEYQQLKADSALLAALMAAGVDSWDGYDHAIEIAEAA